MLTAASRSLAEATSLRVSGTFLALSVAGIGGDAIATFAAQIKPDRRIAMHRDFVAATLGERYLRMARRNRRTVHGRYPIDRHGARSQQLGPLRRAVS